MGLFHVKLGFIPLERKITTAMVSHRFHVTYPHLLVLFFRALVFSKGLCSIHSNTILISFSALKKPVLFIYLIFSYFFFLLFIHIETLATIHKFLSMTNCSPEYYDFILEKLSIRNTELKSLYATSSSQLRIKVCMQFGTYSWGGSG